MLTTDRYPAYGDDSSEILINDHRLLKRLLEDLVSATDAENRAAVLDELKRLLTIHNATEETIVYPALVKVAGEEQEAFELYHDTAEADLLVFELDAALRAEDGDSFGEKAKQLRSAMLEHIEDEENEALPRLHASAGQKASDELTQTVREFRDSFVFRAPTE